MDKSTASGGISDRDCSVVIVVCIICAVRWPYSGLFRVKLTDAVARGWKKNKYDAPLWVGDTMCNPTLLHIMRNVPQLTSLPELCFCECNPTLINVCQASAHHNRLDMSSGLFSDCTGHWL